MGLKLGLNRGVKGPGRAKALEGPTLLRPLPYPQGSGPGLGRAQGLKRKKTIFLTLSPRIEHQPSAILSNPYCEGITEKMFRE